MVPKKNITQKHSMLPEKGPLSAAEFETFTPLIIMPNISESNLAYVFSTPASQAQVDIAMGQNYLRKIAYLGITNIPTPTKIMTQTVERVRRGAIDRVAAPKITGLRQTPPNLSDKLICEKGKCDNQYKLEVVLNERSLAKKLILPIHQEKFNLEMRTLFPKTLADNPFPFAHCSANNVIKPTITIFNVSNLPMVLWEDANGDAMGWSPRMWNSFSNMKEATIKGFLKNQVKDSIFKVNITNGLEIYFASSKTPLIHMFKKILPVSFLSQAARTL